MKSVIGPKAEGKVESGKWKVEMLKGCAAALGRQARFRVLQVFRVFASQ